MNIAERYNLSFKLNRKYHQIARKFAQQQETVAKVKKVYLNTLAVCTVREFIEELSFDTVLANSYSWDAVVRCFEDVADIVVSGIGRVECLSITEDTDFVTVPKEVRSGRIAYVVVQFPEVLNEVQLLGFYPCPSKQINTTEIKIDDLQPMENLVDLLFELELETETEVVTETIISWSIFDKIQGELDRIQKKVSTEIDRVVEESAWILADYKLSAEGTRAIISKDPNQPRNLNQEQLNQKYLKLPLTIAGRNYELTIKCLDLDLNKWKFELRSTEGTIPIGFKFRLLDENGNGFPNNEREATEEGLKTLTFSQVELEQGEGIIWEIEPIPDNYQREIICF